MVGGHSGTGQSTPATSRMGLTKIKYTPEELQKKKEEAERKARRGEIEPTHDFTFSLISRFSGLHKLQILDFIFNDPTILGMIFETLLIHFL